MRMPSAAAFTKTYRAEFPKLRGGLNLRELDYRLSADESPEMENLWWQDGVLQCRDGQVSLTENADLGEGFCSSEAPYYGSIFFHIGAGLYCTDPAAATVTLTKVRDDIPENRGCFFRYREDLFYKNRGGYFRIHWDGSSFTATSAAEEAYIPVTVINASPHSGSGDLYQPENRLSAKKTVRYNADGSMVYHLPVKELDAITEVRVDGTVLTGGFTADLAAGTVSFDAAPPVTEPPTNNTVEITYEKENPDALHSVMDCCFAFTGGGDNDLCILLGGCPAQPNAVFWNANSDLAMDATYFPMNCYNLVGDTEDSVTGFGRQYNTLVVFKQHSIGKLTYSTADLEGRTTPAFTYGDINPQVGCDLPYTIRLVQNNLVFANTDRGVHILRSSSAAYENNVDCISSKINGERSGLLPLLRKAEHVTGFDDDARYWICADGFCYVWDYTVSEPADPSWFYFTGIPAVSFFRDDAHALYHLDREGRLTAMRRVFSDYGAAIRKLYRFPTLFFDSYERLKDVTDVLISVRSDTDTEISIRYDTDYGSRTDLTPILTYSFRFLPRNLDHRCLSTARYACVARRRPNCRHIRHFSMTLTNENPGEDLAIVSTQVFYRYQGKER